MGLTYLCVLVPQAEPHAGPWRETYDANAPLGSPCHVTVLFPFIPTGMLDADVDQRLAGIFAHRQPFDFVLTQVDEFPGVLWLRPVPDQPFRDLRDAVWREFPEYPPFGGEFPDSQPHVTVAFIDSPAEQEQLRQQIAASIGYALPIPSRASEVVLLAQGVDRRWTTARSFPLGPAPT